MSLVALEESSTVTYPAMYRLKHKWTIKDFTAIYLDSPDKNRYPQLYSTLFGSSRDKGTQFKILLVPNGKFSPGQYCISVHLYPNRPFTSKLPTVNCKFSLLDDQNEKCNTQEFRKQLEHFGDFMGFGNYLGHTILLDPDNGLLPDDQLTILAEVDVYSEPVGQFENEFLFAKRTWEAKDVSRSLETLLHSAEHSDVVLVLEKGENVANDEDGKGVKEVAVHKNILSLHSPVFSDMFKTELVERIPIPDMSYGLIENMLDFIYAGFAEDLDYFAKDLYKASEKYGISRLKDLSRECLCYDVAKFNAASMLAFADRHSVDQLKDTCVKFLRGQKLEDVVLTDDWLLVHKVFIEELRLLKLKEKEEEKKEKTPEESQGSNQPVSPKYRLQHKWIIPKFASTYLGEYSFKAFYPQIYSAWFSSSFERHIKFRLRLKPKGSENEQNRNFLSLFIEVRHNSFPTIVKSMDVHFKLSLLNGHNEKCYSRECQREVRHLSKSPDWGISDFISHTSILYPAKGLLPADQLTILAEIDVFPEKFGSECPLGRIEIAARDNLSSSLGTLLESADYSDVVLVVKGQELAAHKNILSAQSPVFSAMFKSEMVESDEGRVLIQDMEIDVAKVFLRFIYTGVVEDLEKYAQELLMAADKYDITKLKALCSQYLCGRLDTDNVAALLTLADRHSVEQLKMTCVKYISDHWQEVMVNKDWPLIDELFIEGLNQLKQKEKEEKKMMEEKVIEESESLN